MAFFAVKTSLLGCLLLAAAFFSFAQPTGSKNSFIPKGYHPLTEATGDLNKDGIPDVALVVENTDPQNFKPNPDGLGADTLNLNDRKLLVLFGNGNGTFRKVAHNTGLLPSEHSDVQSCLADPLMMDGGIEIEKGVLKIALQYWYSCGTWYVNRNTYTLRWQNGRMQLIGFDYYDLHRASGASNSRSINFSTGKQKEVTGTNEFEDPEDPKTVWTNLKNRQPIYLEDLTEEDDF